MGTALQDSHDAWRIVRALLRSQTLPVPPTKATAGKWMFLRQQTRLQEQKRWEKGAGRHLPCVRPSLTLAVPPPPTPHASHLHPATQLPATT